MAWNIGELLSAVPATGPDKVVSLRSGDVLDPPPGFNAAWRRVRQAVTEMDLISAKKADVERRLAEANTQAAEQISRADAELHQLKRKYEEDVELLVRMMNGELRMGIETGGEE